MTPAALLTINIHTDVTFYYIENECSCKNKFIYAYMEEYRSFHFQHPRFKFFYDINILKIYILFFIFEQGLSW